MRNEKLAQAGGRGCITVLILIRLVTKIRRPGLRAVTRRFEAKRRYSVGETNETQETRMDSAWIAWIDG
jgi:hypothetical protein